LWERQVNIVHAADAYSFDHDEIESEREVALVGVFLKELYDYAEVHDDLGPRECIRATFELSKSLRDIEQAGFMVYGGREIQRPEGGIGPPSNWPIAMVRVVRADNPEIIKLKLTEDPD
jgi:hypothetical protein